MSRAVRIAALLLAAAPAAAFAQTVDTEESAPVLENVLVPMVPAGRNDSFVRGIDFELTVADDDPQASAVIGGYSADNDYDASGRAEQLGFSWSVKLTAPVGGEVDLASEALGDALTNGPELSVTLSLFGFESASRALHSEAFQGIMARARDNCAALAAAPEGGCDYTMPDPQFARQQLGSRRVNELLFSGMWRIGATGALGVSSFDFVDPATLAELESTEPEFSGELFAVYYLPDNSTALFARAEYENGFEADDARVVCRLVVVDPGQDCVHGVAAPPGHAERLNLSVELRHVLDLNWSLGTFAISPSATFDTLSDDYAFELPVYFIPRGEWPVSPGIALKYSSETDGFDVGFFLRTSFSIN